MRIGGGGNGSGITLPILIHITTEQWPRGCCCCYCRRKLNRQKHLPANTEQIVLVRMFTFGIRVHSKKQKEKMTEKKLHIGGKSEPRTDVLRRIFGLVRVNYACERNEWTEAREISAPEWTISSSIRAKTSATKCVWVRERELNSYNWNKWKIIIIIETNEIADNILFGWFWRWYDRCRCLCRCTFAWIVWLCLWPRRSTRWMMSHHRNVWIECRTNWCRSKLPRTANFLLISFRCFISNHLLQWMRTRTHTHTHATDHILRHQIRSLFLYARA